MESRANTVLLMLSLVALLLVGAAIADDIIRLLGDAAVGEPSTLGCCNDPKCSDGGLCYCQDQFDDKECAGAGTCKKCKAAAKAEGKYMCRDASWGGAPPKC
ncbi:hypothetical protein ACQ4PT_053514 [Festuca glaucescens]